MEYGESFDNINSMKWHTFIEKLSYIRAKGKFSDHYEKISRQYRGKLL